MRDLAQDLRAVLQAFDGRATTLLGEAEAAFGEEPAYPDTLIALVGDRQPMVGSGATWLLKSYFERGGALSTEQTQALIKALPKAEETHWSTQLHLCQSIRFLDFTANLSTALEAWLTPLLTHKRPFVRAWSLDALAHLAKGQGQYRTNFEVALKRASEDEAASVRARARQILDGH
ncbi:MAG: hypothetical protein AAFR64_10170 [Pseudomonadota bacterium]